MYIHVYINFPTVQTMSVVNILKLYIGYSRYKSTPTRELYICVYIYFLILCRRVTTVTLDVYQVLDAILIFSQYERVEEKSKRKEERNGASSFSKLSPCVYTYI